MPEGAYLKVTYSGLRHPWEDDAEIHRVTLGPLPLEPAMAPVSVDPALAER